jgi:hypothetical protein
MVGSVVAVCSLGELVRSDHDVRWRRAATPTVFSYANELMTVRITLRSSAERFEPLVNKERCQRISLGKIPQTYSLNASACCR